MRVHPAILESQQGLYIDLSDDAMDYLNRHLDHNGNADGMRHVMRHLYRSDYERRTPAGQAAIRAALQYMINCADPELRNDIVYSAPDNLWPPDDKRQLFVWWWEALFDDESYESATICDAEVVPLGVSPGGLQSDRMGAEEWEVYAILGDYEISPEIVRFPRQDGLPPGHGAPPPHRVFRRDVIQAQAQQGRLRRWLTRRRR